MLRKNHFFSLMTLQGIAPSLRRPSGNNAAFPEPGVGFTRKNCLLHITRILMPG